MRNQDTRLALGRGHRATWLDARVDLVLRVVRGMSADKSGGGVRRDSLLRRATRGSSDQGSTYPPWQKPLTSVERRAKCASPSNPLSRRDISRQICAFWPFLCSPRRRQFRVRLQEQHLQPQQL